MSERTLDQKLTEPWHYDEACAYLEGLLEDERDLHGRTLSVIREAEQGIKFARRKKLESVPEFQRLRQEAIDQSANSYNMVVARNKDISRMNKAHPILVPPATADSLYHHQPEKLEYMLGGHLPFDEIFFDFTDPIETDKLNGLDYTKITGCLLYKDISKDATADSFSNQFVAQMLSESCESMQASPGYGIRAFMSGKNQKDMTYRDFWFQTARFADGHQLLVFNTAKFVPEDKGTKDAALGFIDIKNPDSAAVLFEDRATEMYKQIMRGEYPSEEELQDFMSEIDLREVDNPDLFTKLPGLCINLVNYVNAHNIHVRQKTRGKYVPYDGEDLSRLPHSKRPFYLVAIKDGFVDEEQDKAARSWDLKWRYFKRGHNRHFRDDKGDIYLVTWVRPHVVGPPTAPWKEHRYELLARKLDEENAFNRLHGISYGEKS